MSFCVKCGVYIPMDETVCPACGYDPEKETPKQETARDTGAQQQAPPWGEPRQTAKDTRNSYYDSTKEPWESSRQTADPWEAKKPEQDPWAAQKTYTPPWQDPSRFRSRWDSSRTTHQQTGWQEDRGTDDGWQRRQAQSSVANSSLSVLSYFGPLFLIPLFLRQGDPFARFHANQGLLLLLAEALVSVAAEAVPGVGGLISLAGTVFAITCIVRGIRSVLAGRMDKLPVIGDITLLK